MVAPPENTEEETERTFEFIRDLKRINPETEVAVYIYTPLPDESRHESDRPRRPPVPMRDLDGRPVVFPKTAEEWAEPRWLDYACPAYADRKSVVEGKSGSGRVALEGGRLLKKKHNSH